MTTVIDAISLKRCELLHPEMQPKVYAWLLRCSIQNVGVRISQGLRTWGQQHALYSKGRTKPGRIVTYAKAGSSWHNYGLAFDFVLLHKNKTVSWDMLEDLDHDGVADWMEAVQIAKSLGFAWGGDWEGDFQDFPHFDMKFGMTISGAQEKYAKGLMDKDKYIYINVGGSCSP